MRAAVAMDELVAAVVAARAAGRTAVAYLGSPATAHLISGAAYDAATARYAERPWHQRLFGYAQNNRAGGPGGDGVVPVVQRDGTTVARRMTDGFAVFQGPNYALAKTIQVRRGRRRRAIVHRRLRSPQGFPVCTEKV